MLFWPHLTSEGDFEPVNESVFKLLRRSQAKLKEERRADYFWGRPAALFYLGGGTGATGMERFLPFDTGRSRISRPRGRLNFDKNVEVSLGKERRLELLNVKPFQKNKQEPGSRESVRFRLCFTFGGPVAMDVTSDEAAEERRRLLLGSNSRGSYFTGDDDGDGGGEEGRED